MLEGHKCCGRQGKLAGKKDGVLGWSTSNPTSLPYISSYLISKKPAEQWLTNARDHGEADLLDTASWLIFPHVSKSPSESVLVYMKIKPIEN